MRKTYLFIIGLLTLTLSFTGQAMAQSSNQPNTSCSDSLYENNFSCSRLDVESYCNFSAKLGRSNPEYNLYEEVYCNIAKDTDDDIYKILAEQFKVETPNMNEATIKDILENPKIDDSGDAGATSSELYRRVKTSYDRERITYQTKESLKQQFKFAEMWADGTLSNAPFDLIVDLNLIEIIMFGSQAVWKDNVYVWPKDSSDGGTAEGDNGITPGQTPTGPASGAGTNQPPDSSASAGPGIDQYECEPIDKGKELVDNGIVPKPGDVPAGCGDGKKEGDEECDDGNVRAGDGCSEACKKEDVTSLSCQDNEAVTLKPFVPKSQAETGNKPGASDGGGGSSEPPINCPPGSKAVKKSTDKNIVIKQDPNYPGPFVGGILKNFPKSNKGQCPPGSKYTEVSLFGQSAGRCIPHEFCTPDFEKVRKKLFGDNYRNDPAKKKAAEAIEASVCVEFKKINRPESPYSVVEGCIDCQIQAMNDVMEKLLEKNVAPLQNSMQSWGTSNRWGPSVSFDLNVLVQRGLNAIKSPEFASKSQKEGIDKYVKELNQKTTKKLDPNKEQANPTAVDTVQFGQIHSRYQFSKEKEKTEKSEALRNYSMTADASADQVVHAGLVNKLRELKDSFKRIQEKYVQLALAATFHQKAECSF